MLLPYQAALSPSICSAVTHVAACRTRPFSSRLRRQISLCARHKTA